jgi:hypothetical protein
LGRYRASWLRRKTLQMPIWAVPVRYFDSPIQMRKLKNLNFFDIFFIGGAIVRRGCGARHSYYVATQDSESRFLFLSSAISHRQKTLLFRSRSAEPALINALKHMKSAKISILIHNSIRKIDIEKKKKCHLGNARRNLHANFRANPTSGVRERRADTQTDRQTP